MRSFLLIATVIVAATIGCTYKSAGSQSSANIGSTSVQSSPAPAIPTQEKVPCTLTLAGAPTIKGLRLGMRPDEVLDLFPGSRDDAEVKASLARKPNQLGETEFIIRPAKFESKDSFAGITQIVFSLLDGRVTNFYIGYNGPQYSHVDKFVEEISQQSHLPPVNQWDVYVGMDTQLKTLKCSEFEVEAFAGGKGGSLNHITVKDIVAEKTLEKRRDPDAKPNPTLK